MENDNIQKELFKFDAPKKQPNRFGRFFQKADFSVALSAERLVFVSIGIIMLLVVSFALGVEKGKAISVKTLSAASVPAQPAQVTLQTVPVNTVVQKAAHNITVSPGLTDKGKPYMVVAASFSKEAYAAKEADRLKRMGFEAFVLKSEPYYIVCIGSFVNKDSAQKILNKVRQTHQDAYVRLR